ncbi:hypothetical protein L7F22_027137 [Adiantum nelumboides]|nr:hypothetical protein [Adiantum nelumboides]
MATWAALSPQDEEDDDEDIDAYNRSSLLSTPHETIMEEDEEEDEAQGHFFKAKDSAEFSVALQELKSIQSHLYSAAEYCESAYIYSDHKQAIYENLKDYSVKALVNAVDHVGTVAAKLDDLLLQHTKEMSVLNFSMSRLTQHLQAYHDSALCEGLNHFQTAQRRPRYSLQYALLEQPLGEGPKYIEKDQNMLQTRSHEQRQDDTTSDTSAPRSLLWHLTSETPSVSSGCSTPTGHHVVNRSTSSNSRSDKKLQGFLTRSLSGGQFSSPKISPSSSILSTIQEPAHSSGSSKALSSLLSLDETRRHDSQARKKGLLSTFLGKTKSGKPKRLNTLTSFK